ncbi:MAG TPA: FkbM family methyltransferase [Thermoanaerobaculia bacterium]|nr:FkbM family methyltransferase [Thermoanaerobaculia bacterium]
MKELLSFLLARRPRLYARLLRLRAGCNLEKVIFLELLERGQVVFDVGANLGTYTRLFSHVVGPRGRVHAFEPVPATYASLEANVARRPRWENVTLHRLALGDRAGAARIFLPGGDHGQASLMRHRAGSWLGAESIESSDTPLATLDGLVAAGSLPRPDFLKIDVEGGELAVIEGAIATLRDGHPTLCLEVFPEWTASFGYQPLDLLGRLSELGYRRFLLLDAASGLATLAPESLAEWPEPSSANLICLALDQRGARLARRLEALRQARQRRGGGGR